ncbi:MAG: ROK family protein [Bacteroidales bacterium]|nr:ROK family protein [Bacteroidales bacterium]
MQAFAIGIDIGGTNTVIGKIDRQGRVLQRSALKTAAYPDIADYIDALGSAVLQTIGPDTAACAGVGIGAPNASYYTGEIVQAANLPWKNRVPLKALLEQRLGGMPVTLTNDANTAAMGEMLYGAAQHMRDFIVITLGTGVGSGIVCNGELVYGRDGFAGELGHVIVKPHGRACGCGRRGCLETYCSATGVARTARQMLRRTDEDSLLRQTAPDDITSKTVYEAAVQGDALACRIFAFTGKVLGEALANFIAFSSPEAIILFGGLALAGELLLQPVREAIDRNVLAVYRGRTDLIVSTIPSQDAAILGASALAWK